MFLRRLNEVRAVSSFLSLHLYRLVSFRFFVSPFFTYRVKLQRSETTSVRWHLNARFILYAGNKREERKGRKKKQNRTFVAWKRAPRYSKPEANSWNRVGNFYIYIYIFQSLSHTHTHTLSLSITLFSFPISLNFKIKRQNLATTC